MPIKNYMALKGTPSALALDDDQSPHIEVRIEAGGSSYRLAINARSAVPPHDLLYRRQDPFVNPMTASLAALPEGLTDLRQDRPELALDYVRGGFLQRDAMEIAPFERSGPANDLRDYLEPLLQTGITAGSLTLYAFGERWGPEPGNPDKYFGFLPGNGIHDIHMNQGSSGRFQNTNGPNQDGALLIHDSVRDHWSAVFLAFQSQSWRTDAQTGNATTRPPVEHPIIAPLKPSISIIAALVNPSGDESLRESVTLINRSDAGVELDGWEIADRTDRRLALSGALAPGETRRFTIGAGQDAPRLSNKGGTITLLAPDGSFAHAVEYSKADVAREDWTMVF